MYHILSYTLKGILKNQTSLFKGYSSGTILNFGVSNFLSRISICGRRLVPISSIPLNTFPFNNVNTIWLIDYLHCTAITEEDLMGWEGGELETEMDLI